MNHYSLVNRINKVGFEATVNDNLLNLHKAIKKTLGKKAPKIKNVLVYTDTLLTYKKLGPAEKVKKFYASLADDFLVIIKKEVQRPNGRYIRYLPDKLNNSELLSLAKNLTSKLEFLNNIN